MLCSPSSSSQADINHKKGDAFTAFIDADVASCGRGEAAVVVRRELLRRLAAPRHAAPSPTVAAHPPSRDDVDAAEAVVASVFAELALAAATFVDRLRDPAGAASLPPAERRRVGAPARADERTSALADVVACVGARVVDTY